MNFRPERGGSEEPRIDIAPLIDVVFLLLLFFLLTTTFVTQPNIEVNLPKASQEAQPPAEPDRLVVALTREGGLLHEGRAVAPGDLEEIFRQAARDRPEVTVMLQADREVAHGRVVEVMDLARQAGLRKLAIATEAEVGAP